MDNLILFDKDTLKTILKKRSGETKFGEQVILLPNSTNIYDELVNLDVDYVIFGISEDIGVFGNLGNTGTSKAWDATTKILTNIQSNAFLNASKVVILGHLDYSKSLQKLQNLDKTNKKDIAKARRKVAKIDKQVSHLIHQIVKAGKTPIVIGGGHNNAYGNIKGTSLALNSTINAVNFDAHSDFRAEEGRHSGNGFSYAYAEGFLKNYFVFGLHENYTSSTTFKTLDKVKSVAYNTFEAIQIRKELKFKAEMQRALEHVSGTAFGVEIDCDAILNIPSSAMTPSGFSANKARQFTTFFGAHKNAKYLHICEAAPTLETETQVGKLITYLITDFIKAHAN